jgi:hypothetical protein
VRRRRRRALSRARRRAPRQLTLGSKTYEVEDAWSFLELAYEKGWTDGLPVAPPTPDRVAEMVAVSGRPADHVLGTIPPLMGKATVEKVAIQAVMAGCKPEYFPVVLVALECMLTESDNQTFNLRGVQDTTHSASATIGRAVRLILWNLGGARPGETDMTHVGHPGKYSFSVAENPDDDENPWTRLNEEHGYARDQSTVTVFGCEAPRNILVRPGFLAPEAAGTPENALRMIAHSMAAPGSNNAHLMGQCLVTFGPRTAEFVMKAGWTKEKVRQYLFDNARHRLGDLEKNGFWAESGDARNGFWAKYAPWVDQTNRDTMVPVVEKPENIHIIVTGGGVLPVNAICNGWGCLGGYAVTKPVNV